MHALNKADLSDELLSFLAVEGNEPEAASESYWYQRGAIEFAEHLRAAMVGPVITGKVGK